MATKFPISEELQQVVDDNLHIDEVHFTEDGHHHFRVFEHKGAKYTRLHEIPEVTEKSGISTGKHVLAPITDKKGNVLHKIVATVGRQEVLDATPVKTQRSSILSKADILESLEVSEEDLKAFLAANKAKGKK